jgi:hypothetical protein
MDKYGIILVFVFMAFTGWQIFNRRKYKHAWIDKVGGLFWMILGGGGAIMMVIKLLTK